MAFALTFGNFTLEGCSSAQGQNPYRVTEYRVPRRPGSIAPRVPAKDSKKIALQGELWRDTVNDVRDYFDSLQTKLDGGRDRLVLRDDGRFLNAVGQNLDWTFNANSAPAVHASYALQFLADDPYWYASADQSDSQIVGATNQITWTITNAGGARTPLVMELTRTSIENFIQDVIITNTTTGLYMRWNGSFAAGSKLIFDSVNKRVTIAGGNGLSNFAGTFLLLEPGANHLQYDGPGKLTISTVWLERWS